MSYEIFREALKGLDSDNIFYFLKMAAKYSADEKKINSESDDEFKKKFPFVKPGNKNKFKNSSVKNFPLEWFKENIRSNKKYVIYKDNGFTVESVNRFFGVIDVDEDLKKYVDSLIPSSFALKAKIELKAPYYSADDDKFYLIQNPCLKETVFKFPMIRGSAWKGATAKAAKELMSEKLNGKPDNCQLSFRECVQSYLRIFGTGSDEFRNIETMIEEYVKGKSEKLDFKKLIVFLLFELGLKLGKSDIEEIKSPDKVKGWIKKKIWEKFEPNLNTEIPVFLQTHKGKAIFYPSYFDELSIEVINPHDRKKRAGTSPIHYEVVPQDKSTVLQIIYIPFDRVFTKNRDLTTEVKNDIQLLVKSLEKLADTGIGAKTKLGWGRFELKEKKYAINLPMSKDNNFDNIMDGWSKIT